MRLVVLSHVSPVPSTAGQRQRVRYTLEALRREFEVVLVTSAANLNDHPEIVDHADEVHGLGRVERALPSRALAAARGSVAGLASGLKRSNHDIRRLFAPSALRAAVDPASFDLALFHYWHAVDTTGIFQGAGTPCVLDMHDILWRARAAQLEERRLVPELVVRRQQARYRVREQAAWDRFDGIVAINEAECAEVRDVSGRGDRPVWYTPMGVHLDRWPYGHQPAERPRLAYYGGLSTPARELAAQRCVEEIMPVVWERHPACELWIVGANPTERVKRLGRDDRVRVTGFVEGPASVLGSMWAVLCPFTGRFGFRSRLIEVMACGVPVVATPDAVHGMGLADDGSLVLDEDLAGLAAACVGLLDDREDVVRRGRLARAQAERFGFEPTYGDLARGLADFARQRAGRDGVGHSDGPPQGTGTSIGVGVGRTSRSDGRVDSGGTRGSVGP